MSIYICTCQATDFIVLRVPQDGRCPLHCVHLSKTSARGRREWHQQARNDCNFPVNASGDTDVERYKQETDWATTEAHPWQVVNQT